VISCYEAGRDGFWLHRLLVHEGVQNLGGRPRGGRGSDTMREDGRR
jgi:hypothetical protein